MEKKFVYAYINDIAKRLHNPNQFGSASVMVGAGFSKNAISLAENVASPNWEELAKKMYESLYPHPDINDEMNKWEKTMIKKTSGKNVLKLAEEYKVVFGRNRLDKFIEESIGDDKYTPGDLHIKLLELNWNDIFTTNYDTLLERAANNISIRKTYKILVSQNDLPGSTRPRIIKLHGSIPNAKPYIICEEDYRTYPIKYAPFVNTVQQSMLETQLCLIGFSGDDPNFLNWLGWLRDNMGENCPEIYLCGIFSDMSESEKKMLENQNITVLNLECLIDNHSVNRHYDAINAFLELLKNYGQKRNIYKDIPYKYEEFPDKIGKEYYNKMIKYIGDVKDEISKYIVVPLNETEEFHKDLYMHFKYILRDENSIDKFILSSNIAFLLRKCYMPLWDTEVEQIEKLIQKYSPEELQKETTLNSYKSMWFELTMYLAEVYRVDSNIDKYHEVMKRIDSHISKMDSQKKSEYYIEMCKYHISEFNYIQALEMLKKIDGDVSYEIQIKKACLLSQLRMVDDALELLKKCSASIAQKFYSEDKTASLISYINLCARSLNLYGNSMEDFSDKDFTYNKYNIRRIFAESKEKLISSVFAACHNKRGEFQSFNPNSYTYTYGTTPTEAIDAQNNAFRYLLFQDNLCLPIFSDHKQSIAKACTELIATSKNPLWKYSYIIRIDDDEIIKAFFTKERIVTSNKDWIAILFDQLILILEHSQQKCQSLQFESIITKKNIYDIISRLCIVLDDDRIIIFLNKIYSIIQRLDEFNERYIYNALIGISYLFNSNILEKNIDKILNQSFSNNIHLAAFFQNIKIKNPKEQVTEEMIFDVLKEVKSENICIRDNGLTKVVLLDENNVLSDYHQQVSNAIWDQVDEFGFPKSEGYSVILWESLPHNSQIPFAEMYTVYLKNPQFIRCVEGNTVHGIANVDVTINSYINCFYALSNFKDSFLTPIDWNSIIINTILNYIFDYLENEKQLINLRFDIFGAGEEAKKRFSKLSELVAYVFTQSVISNCYDEMGQKWILKLKDVFKETNTSTLSIDILEKLLDGNWNGAYKDIVKEIMRGTWEDTSQAFTALDIILVYKEFINNKVDIEDEMLDLIKSLKYMSIKNSRSILLHLSTVINRKIFLAPQFINVVTTSLNECWDIYEIAINEVNKDYLDSLFNLSNLAKRYYDKLVQNQVQIPEELNLLIDKLKKSPLNEIKNTWDN